MWSWNVLVSAKRFAEFNFEVAEATYNMRVPQAVCEGHRKYKSRSGVGAYIIVKLS